MSTPRKTMGELLILIAEDDELSYTFLAEIFRIKSGNTRLLRAKTGVEAIEQLKSHPDIDIILMDIKMPVMDGLEASREIRKFRPDIPIIAQTAYTSPFAVQNALDAGCQAHLPKPIDFPSLLNEIKRLLRDKLEN